MEFGLKDFFCWLVGDWFVGWLMEEIFGWGEGLFGFLCGFGFSQLLSVSKF